MILPIATLFGRPGNPGSGGVPALTIDPDTGEIIGAGFDTAVAQQLSTQPTVEPWTGDILPTYAAVTPTQEYRNTQYRQRTNTGPYYDFKIYRPPSQLNSGSLLQKHGRVVWNNPGNQQGPSNFDLWRMAGRPTAACHGGMAGLGCADGTSPVNGVCDDGSSPSATNWTSVITDLINTGAAVGVAATLPSGSVVQASPNGTVVTTGAGLPGSTAVLPAGQVAVSGSASPGAWFIGLLIVGAAIYVVTNKGR